MKTLTPQRRRKLLDKLRTMALLQNLLWREAIAISDELLDCELDAVLRQVPDLAVATSGPDVDNFVEGCKRIVVVQNIAIDLPRTRP